MSSNELREKGIQLIVSAQAHEEKKDWPAALADYQSGIEYLVTSVKYEKNQAAAQVINGRIREYLDHAEKIKALVQQDSPAVSEPVGVSPAAAAASDRANQELRQRARELILVEKPDVKWSDVAGLTDVKELLKQSVVYPLRMPQLFDEGRVTAWTGVLLYGPPGTGKTLLAKAVATEGRARTFMHVSVAGIMSKFVGDSERMVKTLFELAREEAPTVIFMDEVDCIAGERNDSEHEVARKVKNQLLQEMEGVGSTGGKHVMVLAATNLPWTLDSAFMRRLQRRIYIPLPERDARQAIFDTALAKMKQHSLSPDDVAHLAAVTEGWSGSDLATLIKVAANHQLDLLPRVTHFLLEGEGPAGTLTPCSADREGAAEISLDKLLDNDMGKNIRLPPVSRADFDAALKTTRPACPPDSASRFEQFRDAGK